MTTENQSFLSSFNDSVTTPVANSLNYPKLATAFAASYVALEVVNHTLLAGYVLPYLAAAGYGAGVVGAVFYGAMSLAVLGVSYAVYKIFFSPKASPIKQLEPVERPA